MYIIGIHLLGQKERKLFPDNAKGMTRKPGYSLSAFALWCYNHYYFMKNRGMDCL